ncbi:tigger transposable element-derived protein 6-like [Rhizophagus clarus]|uniref:Tigger transposable element-derived protein 6-like n=1 Tax=Rhizophagus clarus TaxID=94130 RepID=A0A8H3M006_9GLOM|nr:tigger transposable element-derived protein 6-like [Rhizophagus clarus]
MLLIRSQKVKQTQQTRTAISVDIKKEICEFIFTNPDRKQGDIASFFNKKYTDLNIQKITINKIWKNKEKWLSVLSTSQSSPIATGLPLSDIILQQKGLEFAKMFNMKDKLKYANGWIYQFKKRNKIQKIKLSEEARSAPVESLPEERAHLHTLLAKYDKKDIYNADETGLFFRMKSNQILGNHKFQPLVIGKSSNPRCFKNFNKSALPVTYQANSKAWMRSDIFLEWLNHLDYYFHTLNRKILLLIDNAGSHFNPKRFEKNNDKISNDEVSDENKLNIKEAINYIADAWSNVTQTTIQNCWIKTGILPSGNIKDIDINNNSDDINSDLSELESLFDELPEDSDNLLEYFQMLDKEISTEEILTDEQIINFIKHDESEKDKDDDDDDDDDDVISLVPAKKTVDSLKIFIDYFEQQVDNDFNFNDLQIFKKHLRIVRFKAFDSKNQTTLDAFLN